MIAKSKPNNTNPWTWLFSIAIVLSFFAFVPPAVDSQSTNRSNTTEQLLKTSSPKKSVQFSFNTRANRPIIKSDRSRYICVLAAYGRIITARLIVDQVPIESVNQRKTLPIIYARANADDYPSHSLRD